MGEDRMERGGKRCYYEVSVKCFFLGREKINEIDLSVGRNILFLFKSSIRSIQLTYHFPHPPSLPAPTVLLLLL